MVSLQTHPTLWLEAIPSEAELALFEAEAAAPAELEEDAQQAGEVLAIGLFILLTLAAGAGIAAWFTGGAG